jgi:hypothetical protein
MKDGAKRLMVLNGMLIKVKIQPTFLRTLTFADESLIR